MANTLNEGPAWVGEEKPTRSDDLARELEKTLAREPMDRIKCVHVGGDSYRCNWWAPYEGDNTAKGCYFGTLTSHHVRKSAFVSAVRGAEGLVIRESSRR